MTRLLPTQSNLDILLTWKQMLEDLLEDYYLLGSVGLCGYLESGSGSRVLYVKYEDQRLKTSYGYIADLMHDNNIPGYLYDYDLGIMSPRRISLTQRLLIEINSDINSIQSELDPS